MNLAPDAQTSAAGVAQVRVGASRQPLTQHLNEFDRKNLIHRKGRRIIVDPEELSQV